MGANVSGLWRNYNIPIEIVNVWGKPFPLDVKAVAYFRVLNITNLQTSTYITNTNTIVGPHISTEPNGDIQADNPILTDSRHVEYYPTGTASGAQTNRGDLPVRHRRRL